MNYIAHLLCTFPHPLITLGNAAGDMIRNHQYQQLKGDVHLGVTLHRKIDHLTDQHEAISVMTRMLHDSQGKYAPVFLDIVLDYIMVQRWDFFSTIPFMEFTQWVYQVIEKHGQQLPAPVQVRLENMARHRWMDGYASMDGLTAALRRMDNRASFPSNFEGGAALVPGLSTEFADGLIQFYPALRQEIQQDIADSGFNLQSAVRS